MIFVIGLTHLGSEVSMHIVHSAYKDHMSLWQIIWRALGLSVFIYTIYWNEIEI